jgi:hypothetical protein
MAIDINKIKNKLAQLSGKKRTSSSLWRPEGRHTVRLLPMQNTDGTPFHERYFYYNIGNNRGILAPHQFGKPDPIQELINRLHEDGSSNSRELAKKLYPKLRTYAAVVVRGEEDKGPRLWGFGKQVYQSLLNIMLDADFGDITDPLEGHDLTVSMSKHPGRQFATTEVMPRPKVTPLCEDSKVMEEWISGVPDIDDIYTLQSYDEIKDTVNNWVSSGNNEPSNASDGTEHQSSSRNEKANVEHNKTYNDLDAAFSDLLD